MCILVVEDDELIRMILVEDLIDAGFEVEEAADADQAVVRLVDLHPLLRVLVTDIHMPGSRNGVQLAQHVRRLRPLVPIIFTTGRPDALSHINHLGEGHALVRKPYVPSEVIACILRMLPG